MKPKLKALSHSAHLYFLCVLARLHSVIFCCRGILLLLHKRISFGTRREMFEWYLIYTKMGDCYIFGIWLLGKLNIFPTVSLILQNILNLLPFPFHNSSLSKISNFKSAVVKQKLPANCMKVVLFIGTVAYSKHHQQLNKILFCFF